MSSKLMLMGMVALLAFSGCTTKGEPTPQGELLSVEQISALGTDNSMNGKLVAVEGYPALCGAFNSVTLGKKNKVQIRTKANCNGDNLIDANLLFGGNTVPLSGVQPRNFAAIDEADKSVLIFTTDDYQELPSGKFKFSGTLIYDGNSYYLDNVTIHK